jgi:DNA-directed RNA polymerase specialized sigma24 family protein
LLNTAAQPVALPAVQAHMDLMADQCLEAIRQRDPAAAMVLYTMYASHIRASLEKAGVDNVENLVLSILIQAARSVRARGTASMDELSATVQMFIQQSGADARRIAKPARAMSAERGRELTNRLFTALDRPEREIVLRSALLSEEDEEISSRLNVPLEMIEQTRAKARLLLTGDERRIAKGDRCAVKTVHHRKHRGNHQVRPIQLDPMPAALSSNYFPEMRQARA